VIEYGNRTVSEARKSIDRKIIGHSSILSDSNRKPVSSTGSMHVETQKMPLDKFAPGSLFFKPQDVPLRMLDQVSLGMDELEAIRLADLESLSQEEAAACMNIPRATFVRIVAQGRRKIADVLVHGKAIRIEGGEVEFHPPIPPYRRGRGSHGQGRGSWRSMHDRCRSQIP
jgi:predicted DNA-binding protein (UPF0251 family)